MSRRPEDAENCDYLSKSGPVKKDAPGFPYYMTTTAFLLHTMENLDNKLLLIPNYSNRDGME